MQALERQAVERCDAVLLVSDAEARALAVRSDKVLAVGNGVDTEYFKPPQAEAPGTHSLVFTGTMDYRPNIEGVSWFVREVWPALKRDVPELTFTIVGRNPAAEVERLAAVPGVVVTGTVKDVRPYLERATVAVVPLRIARGIQNKVLEAMAMGRAVVASPGALEGLEIAAGTEALRADSPDEWARCIVSLLRDEPRLSAMENAARARVVADYTWSARMAPLVDLCQRLATIEQAVPGNTEVTGPRTSLGGAAAGSAASSSGGPLLSRASEA